MSNLNPNESELAILNAVGKQAGMVKSARKTDLVEHFKAGLFTLDNIAGYLNSQRTARPHWFKDGGNGSGEPTNKGGSNKGENPWSAANWNVTAQGKIVKALGTEKAAAIARAAGSHIGATKPAKAA